MSQGIIFLLITFLFTTFHTLSALPVLPDPDPAAVHTQTLHRSPPSPPITIPAFPEQSEASGCPLDLPDQLFHGIKSACGAKPHHRPDPNSYSGQLHRTRCCPVLAAWLYSAYSDTALRSPTATKSSPPQTPSYEMPVLPDDSETCVDSLEKALGSRGIELGRPNETCDVVYCYCGIRLHPFSCSEAFSVNSRGKLVGGDAVEKLERDCFSGGVAGGGLGGCSKCLNSLYLLNGERTGRSNKTERTSKMHNRDCELMGLTWLLNKDRSAYIHTVSAVLRALMMNTDDESDPTFCSLNSDGMPLAVDSSEINNQSSSTFLEISLHQYLLPLSLLYMSFIFLVIRY
ncbi:GPI-anchored protein [Perilla frutescens var. frutescens]|nr:GPI-anchored protein [Perilla frutescens var. frutescens]